MELEEIVVLLIDDEQSYAETLIDEASFLNIKIHSFRNLEDGLASFKNDINYDGIILDAKCLITSDQQTEKDDFLAVALQRIQILEQENNKYYPLVVNTGYFDKFSHFSTALEEKRAKIFQKGQSKEPMFDYILEQVKNRPQIELENQIKKIPNLITDGENKNIEFKSTLRYCLKSKKNETYIEHSIIKTIAAFANSDGGTLFIGVDDEKNIIGLKNDINNTKKKDLDSLINSFDDLIKNYLGESKQDLLTHKHLLIKNEEVLIITVNKSNEPVFICKDKDGKQTSEFFIRCQGSSRSLNNEETYKYIKNHIQCFN